MIARLVGQIAEVGADYAVLDVGGVGYLVACSRRTLAKLQPGIAATLLTEMRVRDELPFLYGFGDAGERAWFRTLTTIQGVGAKVALSILSAFTAEELALAVAAGDAKALSRAEGVGPKLAARIAAELKGKASGIGAPVGGTAALSAELGTGGGAVEDAVSALVNLGYGRAEAFAAVAKLGRADADVGTLVTAALKTLARG